MPKAVLITGAAHRIGRAIALAFAKAGWQTVLHCNQSREDAKSLLAELAGTGHRIAQADFHNPAATSALIPDLVQAGLHLDCLVNNASYYSRIPLAEASNEDFRNIFQVNFFAPFELMRAFAAQGGESIINLTDQRTAFVDPAAGPYGLAKKALRDATEAAALDWAPRVRVNAVAPGLVLSPPGVPPERMAPLISRIPLQKRSPEQDVAEACLYLAQASSVTGQTLYIDGGLHLLGHAVETSHKK